MEIKLTRWFVYEWGKPTWQKLHRVILRSPLSRIHYYYQNKQLQVKESQYLIPTYSWTFTPIPNWTCSIVTISHFQCTAPSTWLTNCTDPSTRLNHQLEKDVGCKVLQFINMMKIMKLLGHKALWCTNIVASSREWRIMAKLGFQLHFFTLVELCSCTIVRNLFLPLK